MAKDKDFAGGKARLFSMIQKGWKVGALGLLVAGCAGQPAATAEPSAEDTESQATQAPPPTPVADTATPEEAAPSSEEQAGGGEMAFEITSEAFEAEAPIPVKYTCDGENISPPLTWRDPPEGASSYALISDDPDAPAGTWVHWVLFNIPGDARSLTEAIPADETLPDGSSHGQNSWRTIGYGGPCPPSGTHRYFFKLYALDQMLELPASASKEDLLAAMEGHVLGETELMGTYAR